MARELLVNQTDLVPTGARATISPHSTLLVFDVHLYHRRSANRTASSRTMALGQRTELDVSVIP